MSTYPHLSTGTVAHTIYPGAADPLMAAEAVTA